MYRVKIFDNLGNFLISMSSTSIPRIGEKIRYTYRGTTHVIKIVDIIYDYVEGNFVDVPVEIRAEFVK